MPFVLGSAPVGRSTLRHLNARGRQSRPCAILRRLWRLRIYGAKAPPARRPVRVILSKCCRKSGISILTGPSKTKGTTKVVPFVLGSAAQWAAPPFGDSNARGRQSRPCAILRRLRRLRIYAALAARPRRAVGWYSVHSHKAEKIDFNHSLQKEGHDRRSCPSFWIPPPGGRRSSIHLPSSQNFCNITAVWARVARPWGERALSPVPLMIPAPQAHWRAETAYSDTSKASA